MNNVDFAAFPPSKACLEQHIRRVNYQVRIWKLANVPISDVPNPWEGHGWQETGEPLWCSPGWILPSSMADMIGEVEEVDKQRDNEDCADDEDVFEDEDMPTYDEIDVESDDSSYDSDE